MLSRTLSLLLGLLCWATLVEAQAPGTWTEFPNSKYDQSAAICGKPGALPEPNCVPTNYGMQNAVDAWVDGDYCSHLSMFIIPRGGGHADGQGNQVIGFRPDTATWHLLTYPSRNAWPLQPWPSPTPPERAIYPDGTPSSVHSYGAVACMSWINKVWSAGGIYWSPGGESVPPVTWWWDPAVSPSTPTTAWTQKFTRPGGYGTYAVADPPMQRVLFWTSSALYAYNPAIDTGPTGPNPYTVLFSQPGNPSNSARTIDQAGRKLYSVTPKSGGGALVRRTDLNNLAAKEVTLSTTGFPTTLQYGAGLIFDAGRLVMLGPGPIAGTAALWTLDPTVCGVSPNPPACVWTRETSPNGVYSTATDTAHGTWRKFFRHGCDFYHIAGGGKNVWKVRPSWQTDTCQAPPAQHTLTITKTGDGDGTVTGAGTYPLNTVVPMGQTPDATSTAQGFGGDADCLDGSVTMTANKACTAAFAKIRVTLALAKSGTGAGTVSGAGTYVINTQAQVGATADSGSTVGAVTGSVGCQIGPVTMDANKACTIEFRDTQPPAITLTTPVDNQIIKAVTPIVVSVADNMPSPVTTTFLVDGLPLATPPVLDPATLTEGVHQLLVRSVDAAGNSTQITRNFFSVIVPECPVCPPPTAPTAATLSHTTTGAGHGSVTGPSGPQKVGDPITLTPTPAEDSLYLGVSPALCDQKPFPMPSTDLTCTFAFNLKPPPPPMFTLTTTVVGQGTVSGGGEYLAAAPVVLGGSPASGWLDQGWSPAPCGPSFPMPAQDLMCTRTYTQPPPSPGTAPVDGLQPRVWKGIPYGTVLGQSKHARVVFDSKRKRMVVAGGDGTDGTGNSYKGQYVHSIDLAQSATWTRHHGGCPPTGAPQVMPFQSDNTTWVYDSTRDRMTIMPAFYEIAENKKFTTTTFPTDWTVVEQLPTGVQILRDPAGKLWAWNQTIALALQCGNRYIPDFTKRPYTFDPTVNLWSVATVVAGGSGGWGGDSHNHFGVYDPVTDSTYRFWNGCGLHRVLMNGATSPSCYPLTFPSTPPGSSDMSNDQSAIDVQGRHIYVIARYKNHLLKWNIDQQKVVKYIPMPSTWRRPESEFGGGDYETHLSFDSKNRVLLVTHDMSYGCESHQPCAATSQGTLIGTSANPNENRGVYWMNVDTEVWEHDLAPVGAKVSGNVLGYDAANNVFLYFGRSPTNQIWLYRYKD